MLRGNNIFVGNLGRMLNMAAMLVTAQKSSTEPVG